MHTKLKNLSFAIAAASALNYSTSVFAENILSEINLNANNSDIELLYVVNNLNDWSVLGDIAYNEWPNGVSDAKTFINNTFTTSSSLLESPGSDIYKYVLVSFPVTLSGTYTFGQTSAPSDTFLLVYNGTVNPEDLSSNLLTGNDDSGVNRGWNSGATVPPGVTVVACGSENDGDDPLRCPIVQKDLTAGTTYTLLLSHYGTWDFDNFGLPSDIFVYGPNEVVFQTTGLSVLGSSKVLLNAPAYGGAAIIDANSNLHNLFLSLSSDSEIANAASQTLPLLTGASSEGVRAALTSINRVIQSRISSNKGMSSGDAEIGSDKYMWIKPFSSWANQDDVLSISGFESHTEGLAIGADGAVSDTTRLGFAVSYANSRIDSNSTIAPQNADINLYQVIGYGSKTLTNDTELNFQVDYGMNKNKASRSILFTDSVASSSYDSKVAHAALGLGKTYAINDNNTFTASLRGDYTVIKDDAYIETGAGDLNLSVDSRTSKEFVVSIDGKYLHAFDKNLSLATKVGVGYDTLNEQASLTAAYAGAPTASFVTDGLRPDPVIGKVGIGLLHQADSGAELTMDYDAEYRDGFLNQTASFKARWMF